MWWLAWKNWGKILIWSSFSIIHRKSKSDDDLKNKTKSHTCEPAEVGRDLWRSRSPILLLKAGLVREVTQNCENYMSRCLFYCGRGGREVRSSGQNWIQYLWMWFHQFSCCKFALVHPALKNFEFGSLSCIEPEQCYQSIPSLWREHQSPKNPHFFWPCTLN